MEIAQLKGFRAVVEERKFSLAARRVFLSQPAISMQIKALEEEFGEKLLHRSRKEIVPTAAGKILYQQARKILDEVELTGQKIMNLKGIQIGHLGIGCSDTISHYILPNILKSFLLKFPGIEVGIQNKPTHQIIQMVQDRIVDVGVISLPFTASNLISKRLFTFKEIALCSREHPLAIKKSVDLKSLTRERLLLLEKSTQSRIILEKVFMSLDLNPTAIMEFGSVEVQKSFAEINLGVAIIPEFAFREDNTKLIALPISDIGEREIGVVYHAKGEASKIVAAFISELEIKT